MRWRLVVNRGFGDNAERLIGAGHEAFAERIPPVLCV